MNNPPTHEAGTPDREGDKPALTVECLGCGEPVTRDDAALDPYCRDECADAHRARCEQQDALAAAIEARQAADAEAEAEAATRWWTPLPDKDDAERPTPTLLVRNDGRAIFYERRYNSLFGASGVGKSWVLIETSKQAAEAGGRVIFWDWEDTPDTLVARLLVMGGDRLLALMRDTDRFRYVASTDLYHHDGASLPPLDGALAWLQGSTGPQLVIIDTTGAAGAPQEAGGQEWYDWKQAHVDPWLDAGCTVISCDHRPKNTANSGRGAIGPQAKRASVNGAQIRVEGRPFNADTSGYVTLYLDKDKNGRVPGTGDKCAQLDDEVATLRGTYSDGGGFKLELEAPSAKNRGGADDHVRRLIMTALRAASEGMSANELCIAVEGRHDTIRRVAKQMASEQIIDVVTDARKHIYRVPDASCRVPDATENDASRVPPPRGDADAIRDAMSLEHHSADGGLCSCGSGDLAESCRERRRS